jgi:hypothetical protein
MPAPTSTTTLQYTPFSRKLTGSLDQISKTIQENAKVIDMIQEVALELTTSISTLHALTVKYAGIANAILDGLLPIVRGLPIVPKKVLEMLVSLESITQKIIDNEVETTRTINNVKDGLTTGDVSKLQGLNDELQVLTKTLTSILPK